MKKKNIKKPVATKRNLPKIPWLPILIGIGILLLILLFDPRTFLGGDNCHYMSLAQSILHKHYRTEAFIGAPPETGVTPGYPFILAISLATFGRTFIPAKIFSFVCFLTSLLIWWKLFNRQGIDKRVSIGFLAFAVINPLISEFSHWELTEAPFMLISSAAILYYLVSLQKDNKLNWIITAILAAASFYMRAAGIAIPIAIGFALLLQRKWNQFFIYSIAVVVLVSPWLLRMMTVGKQTGGGIYLPQFFSNPDTGETLSMGGFIAKAFRNLSRYLFVNLPTMFFPIGQDNFVTKAFLGYLIGSVFSISILIGVFNNIRSKLSVYSLYIVISILILISFSEQAAIVRYLVVIFPFIAVLLLLGLEKIWKKIQTKPAYSFGIILLLVILALPSYFKAESANRSVLSQYLKGNKYADYGANFVRFIEVNEWIKSNDNTNSGVISRKPTLTWWYSNHPSKGYIWRTDVKQVKNDIDTSGAKFVIVDQISGTTQQYLIPTIRAFPQNFKVLYVTQRPENYVLEFIRNP